MKMLMLSMLVLVTAAPAPRMAAAPAITVVHSAMQEGAPPAAMARVIDPYLRVQTKLAADTIDGVAADASAIAAGAAALGNAGAPIATGAKALQAATTIDAARDAFWNMTTALLAYADSTKTDLGPDVRRTYCPMEKKSWAQKNGLIANPYAGKRMLRCGVFTDKK